jgi:hypothetical protein
MEMENHHPVFYRKNLLPPVNKKKEKSIKFSSSPEDHLATAICLGRSGNRALQIGNQ